VVEGAEEEEEAEGGLRERNLRIAATSAWREEFWRGEGEERSDEQNGR